MRMVIFLSVFITLYGSLHFYALMKTGRAFGFHKGHILPLALFMVFMVICPILVRLVERTGMEALARMLAYAGYTWMGFLFLFVAAAAVLDIYRLFIYAGIHLGGGSFSKGMLSAKALFYIAFSGAVLGGIYGLVEARSVGTEHVVIRTEKIPEEVGRLRIVQISDVHLGLIIGKAGLSRILDVVRAAKPDILVSTGDLLDAQIDGIEDLGVEFHEIKTPYGKFAVNGNHEYYVGIDRARAFCKRAGFTLLENEAFDIPGIMVLAGVNDRAAGRFGLPRGDREKRLLRKWPRSQFIVLLKHRPELDPETKPLFDLQLSGHTHRGQIFPFSLIIEMLYPVASGLFQFPHGGFLYVNRGSGTWGPPMRVLSPPEVTVIDLVHGKRKKVDFVTTGG